jgi:monofunctional biosynthetic peptidoglycan transglycosylase
MDPNRPRVAPSVVPRADAPPPAPHDEMPPPLEPLHRAGPSWFGRVRRALLWMLLALFVLALMPPAIVLALRWWAPPTTSFMLRSEVQPVAYHWVPRQRIPESLRRAVVAAEDQKFWTHWGFDFIAIAEALEHNETSKRTRGASTITQQTAKNLFLWPGRSWLRKGLEVSFTLLLEGLWPKERILEVYLNIAEFGPGIYGVEAAAQRLFKKPADKLTPVETAHLAAVLPNPRKWHADRPGPYVQSRVDWILVHTGQRPRFSAFPEPEPEAPAVSGEEMPDAGAAPAPEMPDTTEAMPVAPESEQPADDDTPEAVPPEEAPTTEEAPSAESQPPPDPAAPAEAPRYAP